MNSQLKRVYRQDTQEEQLYDIKHKTVPQELSDTWRSPLNNSQPWYAKAPKSYSELESLQHKTIYKENFHNAQNNPKLSFMKDSLQVLKKLMEQEKDGNKEEQ